uniref:Putative secreted salivary peptide of 6.78 kDa n=1 Tax=Ixodes ricinus TaxID=34613 RepID=V5HDR8_IXORI
MNILIVCIVIANVVISQGNVEEAGRTNYEIQERSLLIFRPLVSADTSANKIEVTEESKTTRQTTSCTNRYVRPSDRTTRLTRRRRS